MRWRLFACFCVSALPHTATAATCPPPYEFANRKAELLEAVRSTYSESAGRYLTRELFEIWATAPDRQAQLLLDRGMRERAQGDFKGAKESLSALIVYCPDYAEGYSQRAFVHIQTGDFDKALADLDAALERAPSHVAAMAGKAVSLTALGQVADGQRVLEEALALNPWLPERSLLLAPPGEQL